MKNKIIYIFTATLLLCTTLLSCNSNMGIGTIDAYKLKFGNTHLFTDSDKFFAEIGLPTTVTVFKDTFNISSPNDLTKALELAAKSQSDMIGLHYNGFVMDYVPDGRIVPERIDFRKTDKQIEYNNVKFDSNFTVDMFKDMFPASGSTPLDGSISLFKLITKESDPGFTHFMVLRKSVDDPYAAPTLEFTFKNGKLIYIFFANF